MPFTPRRPTGPVQPGSPVTGHHIQPSPVSQGYLQDLELAGGMSLPTIEEILFGNVNRNPRNMSRVTAMQGNLPNTTVGGKVGLTNGDIDSLLMQISPNARAEATARAGMSALAAPAAPIDNPWAFDDDKAALDARARAIMDEMKALNPHYVDETVISPTERPPNGHLTDALRYTEPSSGPGPGWKNYHQQQLAKREEGRRRQTDRAQARAMGGVAYDQSRFGDLGGGGMDPRMAIAQMEMALQQAKLAEDARQFDETLGAAQGDDAKYWQAIQSGMDPNTAAAAVEAGRYYNGQQGGFSSPAPMSAPPMRQDGASMPNPLLQIPNAEGGTLMQELEDAVGSTRAPWHSFITDNMGNGSNPDSPPANYNWMARLADKVNELRQGGQIMPHNQAAVAEYLRNELSRQGMEGSGVFQQDADAILGSMDSYLNGPRGERWAGRSSPEMDYLLQLLGG